MSEEPEAASMDVAGIERWLDDPRTSIAEIMAEFPLVRTKEEAREFLETIRIGLEDVRQGRTIPHAQILRDVEERKRRYRASAAE